MKEIKKQVAKLKRGTAGDASISRFEREYKKGGWNLEGRETAGR